MTTETKYKPISVVVTQEIEPERIIDLLVTAFEGGSNYWYWIERVNHPEGKSAADYEYPLYEVPLDEGGSLIIRDIEGQVEGDYVLDRAAIAKGFRLMAQDYPKHFSDFMDENEDADTADVFLQLCLFDKVIFG